MHQPRVSTLALPRGRVMFKLTKLCLNRQDRPAKGDLQVVLKDEPVQSQPQNSSWIAHLNTKCERRFLLLILDGGLEQVRLDLSSFLRTPGATPLPPRYRIVCHSPLVGSSTSDSPRMVIQWVSQQRLQGYQILNCPTLDMTFKSHDDYSQMIHILEQLPLLCTKEVRGQPSSQPPSQPPSQSLSQPTFQSSSQPTHRSSWAQPSTFVCGVNPPASSLGFYRSHSTLSLHGHPDRRPLSAAAAAPTSGASPIPFSVPPSTRSGGNPYFSSGWTGLSFHTEIQDNRLSEASPETSVATLTGLSSLGCANEEIVQIPLQNFSAPNMTSSPTMESPSNPDLSSSFDRGRPFSQPAHEDGLFASASNPIESQQRSSRTATLPSVSDLKSQMVPPKRKLPFGDIRAGKKGKPELKTGAASTPVISAEAHTKDTRPAQDDLASGGAIAPSSTSSSRHAVEKGVQTDSARELANERRVKSEVICKVLAMVSEAEDLDSMIEDVMSECDSAILAETGDSEAMETQRHEITYLHAYKFQQKLADICEKLLE